MSAPSASDTATLRPARPVTVTIAVTLIYVSALVGAGVGILVLLSRYEVPPEAVLPVSLLGAAIILFGLLMLAVGGGVARGSRLSRGLISGYLAISLVLHVVTIVSTDAWDWTEYVQIAIELLVLAALWLPPGARYFRSEPDASAGAAGASARAT